MNKTILAFLDNIILYLVLKEQPSIAYSSGDYGEEVTPVPMPNTEVKLFSANGSWGISPCESRTLPGK
jgi:hypothetical protein